MNSKLTRRQIAGAAIIIAVALAGLALMNGGDASAERGVDLPNFGAASSQEATPGSFDGSALPSLLRIVSALAVVIACIYGGIYLLKRMSGRRGGFGGKRSLEVIETTAIAPKKMISLVRVADKAVLIGITESGMTALTELSAEKTSEIMADQQAARETDGFRNALHTASGKIRLFGSVKKPATLDA